MLALLAYTGIGILVVVALLRGASGLGYRWQWYRMPPFLFTITADGWRPGPLLEGLGVTFRVVGISFLCAAAAGTLTAILRISGPVSGRWVSRVYVESIRNTPLLIQIFFIYFVLAPLMGMGRFAAAVLALSLFEGAYVSEIIRAGILAVGGGQWEAARSLGFSSVQAYRYVVLPQAAKLMLPPLAGQSVSLVKDSALVSTIAIYDLTMRGREIIAETYLVFEVWLTVGVIYLLVTGTLSTLVYLLEKRLATASVPRH